MMRKQLLMRGWVVLLFGLTAVLMVTLPGTSIAATEDTVALAAYGKALESTPDQADGADTSLVQVADKPSHGKMKDCPSVEVDEQGKPIGATEKDKGTRFFPCYRISNGQGGFKCSALTPDGTVGCNNCPTCVCRESGSGATQNCRCVQGP